MQQNLVQEARHCDDNPSTSSLHAAEVENSGNLGVPRALIQSLSPFFTPKASLIMKMGFFVLPIVRFGELGAEDLLFPGIVQS